MKGEGQEPYGLIRHRPNTEGGHYEDIRIHGGLVNVLCSEGYRKGDDDHAGIKRFGLELEPVDRFGYGHVHSPWKKMAYAFDDIIHDEAKREERERLIEYAASLHDVTIDAVLADPGRFLFSLRQKFDEEYANEVRRKEGILVKPAAFDILKERTFIADHDQATVYFYDEGVYAGRLGDKGVGQGELLRPSGAKILDGILYILDFPKNPGEYFVDKPCLARVQAWDPGGKYISETILEDVRVKPSEWGQTALEVTADRIFVSNRNDLYVRGRKGGFAADIHFKDSRVTGLRASHKMLGVGFYDYGGILFLNTLSGRAEGFLQTKDPEDGDKVEPKAFDFYGDMLYVASQDCLFSYEIREHRIPAEFRIDIARR